MSQLTQHIPLAVSGTLLQSYNYYSSTFYTCHKNALKYTCYLVHWILHEALSPFIHVCMHPLASNSTVVKDLPFSSGLLAGCFP